MLKNYEKLLQYSLFLLARKQYTIKEMHRKLEQFSKKNELGSDKIPEVLERLTELRYLNDEQFAEDYLSNRVKFRPKGIYLIKKELEKKGIFKSIIDEVLNETEINEVEMAERLLKKKVKFWAKFDARKIREKSYFFLASKGFKPDAIYKAVSRCYDLSVDDEDLNY